MAFYDKFPYTNFQELNLDRIIQELISVKEGLDFVIKNASLKYADPIQWNITTQYQTNTVVIDPATGVAYISTQPVPINVQITDTDYWTPVFDLGILFESIKKSIDFDIETAGNSEHDYATGNYLFIENSLYEVLQPIAVGTAFAENINVKKVCVTDLIEIIQGSIVNINDNINTIDRQIGDINAVLENVLPDAIENVNAGLDMKFNSVFISTIRAEHPEYTDDELMNTAIAKAIEMDSHPIIVWDHHDARFSGGYSFNLTKTAGVDFNLQTIYMPPVDVTLFYVNADDGTNKSVSSAVFNEYFTTDPSLNNKYFAVNTSNAGCSEMCAGDRVGQTGEIYVCFGLVTDPKGQYTNNKFNYLPSSTAPVPLYNVHTVPEYITEFKNAYVEYPASDKMALLFKNSRSKVHVSNITVSGHTNVTTYHTGVISVSRCAYIEIDHIYGSNPIQESLTSGYLVSLFDGCTDIYIHDCDMHDSEYVSWGNFGINCITNTTFERVNTQRFDCHYFAWGYVTIRDCHLDYANICAGVCNWTFDSVIFTRRLATLHHFISLRSDSPGRPQGSVKITNCLTRTERNLGANPNTTRFLNMTMTHNPTGNFTASGILSSTTMVYLSDCDVRDCMCVLQAEDEDSGNGSSSYTKMSMLVNNCGIYIDNINPNSYLLYRYHNDAVSAVQDIAVCNTRLQVTTLSSSECASMYLTNCALSISIPLKCTRIITNFLINNCRFGGFDITAGQMFNNLVCTGNYVDRYQTQISTSLATTYVFEGNASRDSTNIGLWMHSNSYNL